MAEFMQGILDRLFKRQPEAVELDGLDLNYGTAEQQKVARDCIVFARKRLDRLINSSSSRREEVASVRNEDALRKLLLAVFPTKTDNPREVGRWVKCFDPRLLSHEEKWKGLTTVRVDTVEGEFHQLKFSGSAPRVGPLDSQGLPERVTQGEVFLGLIRSIAETRFLEEKHS